MAYGDQVDPKNRIMAIILVGALTLLMGYGLVTGLNISVVKKLAEKLDVVEVDEPPPPEEPPPPPPPDDKLPPPPPVVTPPSKFPPSNQSNVVQSVDTPPPTPPAPIPPVAPAAPPAPPAAPPPTPDKSKAASPKNKPQSWATTDDYPARALREEREGVVRFRLAVGGDGRAADCQITGSSGHADLDEATCKFARQRARFNPALDRDGNPTTGTYNGSVRWQIPKE